MDEEEIKKFEGKPICFSFSFGNYHRGYSHGFVYNSQCYSFSHGDEKIFIGRVSSKYVTSVEKPRLKISLLEESLVPAVNKQGPEGVHSIKGIPVETFKERYMG